MTHRCFGAAGLLVGAVLVASVLSACTSTSSNEKSLDAVNLGIPTRDVAQRTSVILHGTGTPVFLTHTKVAELTTEAESSGVPVNELFAQERGRSEFRTAMSTIGRANADILVSWNFATDETYDAWVLFNEEPPAEVTALITASPLDVLVEYGVNTDAAELTRVTDAIDETLSDVDGISLLSTSWDVRTARIRVDMIVENSSIDVEAAKREALEKATAVSVDGELPGIIEFDAKAAASTPEPSPAG